MLAHYIFPVGSFKKFESGVIGAQRSSEITLERVNRKAEILDKDGLIEAELVAKIGKLLRRRTLSQQQRRHIAREHMHGKEDDEADSDKHEQQLEQPSSYKSRHRPTRQRLAALRLFRRRRTRRPGPIRSLPTLWTRRRSLHGIPKAGPVKS